MGVMKWVCIYCKKVMDRANFIEFINESDITGAEYHGWKLMADRPAD